MSCSPQGLSGLWELGEAFQVTAPSERGHDFSQMNFRSVLTLRGHLKQRLKPRTPLAKISYPWVDLVVGTVFLIRTNCFRKMVMITLYAKQKKTHTHTHTHKRTKNTHTHKIKRTKNTKEHTHKRTKASQVVLVVKIMPDSARDAGDVGSIPGLGRSPGEGNSYPLQYSCLENHMDRGAWEATVHRVAKSWTQLKRHSIHAHPLLKIRSFRRKMNVSS